MAAILHRLAFTLLFLNVIAKRRMHKNNGKINPNCTCLLFHVVTKHSYYLFSFYCMPYVTATASIMFLTLCESSLLTQTLLAIHLRQVYDISMYTLFTTSSLLLI